MLNVAIAGGNGALGRTLVDAFRGEGSDEYQTFILTRRKRDVNDKQELEVVYRNVDALRKMLEEHEIHTVICTFDMTPRGLSVSQMNLIKAASQSRCTRRFIPTSYSIAYPRSVIGKLPGLREHFECLDALAKTDLEWTTIVNGIFLDSYGMPNVQTHLKPSVVVVDMAARRAAIPGSGDVPVSFTYSRDVARFVVKAVGLKEGEWQRETRIVGDTLTWRWFVRTAEEVTGTRFEVVYDPVEKLREFEVSELPGHRDLYGYSAHSKERLQLYLSVFELATTDETGLVKREGSLNERFPEVKAMTVRDMMEQCWAPSRGRR